MGEADGVWRRLSGGETTAGSVDPGLEPPGALECRRGDEDPVVPLVNGRFLARALPRGRLAVVRGAGHLFLYDEPTSVTAELAAFLAG